MIRGAAFTPATVGRGSHPGGMLDGLALTGVARS